MVREGELVLTFFHPSATEFGEIESGEGSVVPITPGGASSSNQEEILGQINPERSHDPTFDVPVAVKTWGGEVAASTRLPHRAA